MALPPITNYRTTPPVDNVGDRRHKGLHRDFMDLIRSDDRIHERSAEGRNREQQANDQDAQSQESLRQTRIAADRARDRMRLINLPANTQAQQPRTPPPDAFRPGVASRNALQGGAAPVAGNPARRPGTDAGELQGMTASARGLVEAPVVLVPRRDRDARDNSARPAPIGRQPASQSEPPRDAAQATAAAVQPQSQDGVVRPGIRPGQRTQPRFEPPQAPVAPAPPRWPEPPAGSSLVVASPTAAALNLVASGQGQPPESPFRLSREVPREVADRINQFLRTGILNRSPFSFAQVDTVEARATGAGEPSGGDKPATAPGSLSSRLTLASLGTLAAKPQTAEDLVARQTRVTAAIPKLVQAVIGGPVEAPDRPSSGRDLGDAVTVRGAANPLFGTSFSQAHPAGRDDDVIIDLIAGSRGQSRRDRIA